MNKFRLFLLVLTVLLLCTALSASAENHLVAYVQGSTSDRVHLRSEANTGSASLGLYFTGTPVMQIAREWDSDWTYVAIGAERGYMHNSLLASPAVFDGSTAQWKQATVHASGWVNMRCAPSKEALVLDKIDDGALVAVLGETADRWCYIKANDTCGYIMSRYLNVGDELYAPSATEAVLPFLSSPTDFLFTSGAGGWDTTMTLLPDGTFFGYFHDADMGVAEVAYPHGTLYECAFTGRFSQLEQISDWEYQMTVENLQQLGIAGSSQIRNQTNVVTTEPYGLMQRETISFYLPNAPADSLPEAYLMWVGQHNGLGFYGHTSEAGWMIYE